MLLSKVRFYNIAWCIYVFCFECIRNICLD